MDANLPDDPFPRKLIPHQYYWVHLQGAWEPAFYDGEEWSFIGTEELFSTDDIEGIGELIPHPETGRPSDG